MLKIVHLVTGASALLFALILANNNLAAGLLLASFAAANLLIAPILPTWARGGRRQLQTLVSGLIVLATVMQTILMLTGVVQAEGHILSVTTLISAVILHLAGTIVRRYPDEQRYSEVV